MERDDFHDMTALTARVEARGLRVLGALHPDATGAKGIAGGTLVLLGTGPGFWPLFQNSPERADEAPDPVDRWSLRVVGGLAQEFGATAYFPFGGPPHAPFVDWALKSGRVFTSPAGMLVHDGVGMLISYRGALHLPQVWTLPRAPGLSPCNGCRDRPCLSACPGHALGGSPAYDLPRCHATLDRPAGADCMARGCLARRACPASAGARRDPDQTALHMAAFHPPAKN